MKVPESSTEYEVWEQVGGFQPSRCLSRLSKEQAEEQVAEWTQHNERFNRPEAAQRRLAVVKAVTHREVVQS